MGPAYPLSHYTPFIYLCIGSSLVPCLSGAGDGPCASGGAALRHPLVLPQRQQLHCQQGKLHTLPPTIHTHT